MSTSLLRRPLAGGTVAVLAALCLGASASAASAQTLDGEKFVNADHREAIYWEGECNADGPSTFAFGTFGDATGPIPGTYNEGGEITLASPSGPVTSFTSSYTLMPDDGEWITGTRTLTDTISASCTPSPYGGSDSLAFEVAADYDVLDPFTESGPSIVTLGAGTDNTGFTAAFGEQGSPPPAAPTSKEDCMDGGWRPYGFKNQGACIKFVVTGKR